MTRETGIGIGPPGSGSEGGEFTGAPSNIIVSNNDLATTTVSGNPNVFVVANLTTPVTPPVMGYDNDFKSDGTNTATIEHEMGEGHEYRLDFNGTVVASDPAFLNTYIGVKIVSDSGQEFTGGLKSYPVGVSLGGASPAIGFSVAVFGAIAGGEKLSVQLSSNTAGDLTLTDLIVFAVRITPAG